MLNREALSMVNIESHTKHAHTHMHTHTRCVLQPVEKIKDYMSLNKNQTCGNLWQAFCQELTPKSVCLNVWIHLNTLAVLVKRLRAWFCVLGLASVGKNIARIWQDNVWTSGKVVQRTSANVLFTIKSKLHMGCCTKGEDNINIANTRKSQSQPVRDKRA